MAKRKNKKISADHVHSKKESQKARKIMNPFEIHVNKEKLRVIGKKQKNDRGLPGISRAKAIQKRKHTLLKEYKDLHKSNKFTDKRIGERSFMPDEDKVIARFTAVRVKAHNKKSIFNLADDEVLTHKGQTLSEIEKFEDPRSDDESLDGENGSGKLNEQFVEDVHFGGGILKNTGKEGAKTHKELIEQLIAESKKRKAEMQKTKEATLELTEKLDSEWKDLLPIVNACKKAEEEEKSKQKIDDYDKVMRELKFEARGTVSDKLKTEDEIAKEEKEKLEQLEQERLKRMRGEIEKTNLKLNHRSADDLDDDLVYEADPDYMLSYNNEGEANVEIDAEINGKSITRNNESEDENQNGENDSEGEELETDSEDNLSDLKGDNSESDSDSEQPNLDIENPVENTKIDNEVMVEIEKLSEKEEERGENEIVIDDIKEDLLKRKEIMEQAKKELPYTFALPESYESLQKTLENQSSSHQSVIIERMIKCNLPSLGEGNKENLGLLFAYLLQYVNDLFEDVSDAKTIKNNFEIFNALVPQIYDLAQLNPENAHNSVLEVLKEKHGEYREKPRKYPGYEILAFLKLISFLFTTSDFRHQVVTPSFVFIEQMLTKCRVNGKSDISYGLFLSTLVLEYTVLSKRYLPAVVNFLSGLLHTAIPKTSAKLVKVLPPFKSSASNLSLTSNHSLDSFKSLRLDSKDLLKGDTDEEYKVRALYVAIKLLQEFYGNLKELSSSNEIFEPVLGYLEQIPTKNYPEEVKKCLDDLKTLIKNGKENKVLKYIVMESERPKALRLYEPKIEEVRDGKKYKKQSKEKTERDKMLHKLKREKKGALREIRRDKAFLGRVKINEKIQSDKERREKVKRLYAEAAMQQSELNELDRKKKRKK